MATIKLITDIKLGNRVRRHFDESAIRKLADGIVSKGLMHPIVIHPGNLLCAGERRLRAITLLDGEGRDYSYDGQQVGKGSIPCTLLSNLNDGDKLEAELEENLLRESLTWPERVAGEARLHELRVSQRGTYHKGINPEGQSVEKTATELARADGKEQASGSAQASLKNSLILAPHLDDPEVAAAATKEDALRVVKKKLLDELGGVLAGRAKATRHTILCQDFRTDTSVDNVDIIVTDPPYGVGADSFGSQTALSTTHEYKDDMNYWREIFPALCERGYNSCRPKAHLYAFVSFDNYQEAKGMLSAAGWRVWHRPLIWDKGNQGLVPDADHGPRYVHDYIIYALKGEKVVNGVFPDVIRVNQEAMLNRAAEKPVDLYANLLERSAKPGDHVWDPFCGTGPIFRAAERLSLTATGHDIDPAAINKAKALLSGDIT